MNKKWFFLLSLLASISLAQATEVISAEKRIIGEVGIALPLTRDAQGVTCQRYIVSSVIDDEAVTVKVGKLCDDVLPLSIVKAAPGALALRFVPDETGLAGRHVIEVSK